MDDNWDSDARGSMISMTKAEGKQLHLEGSGGSGRRKWELHESKGGRASKRKISGRIDATYLHIKSCYSMIINDLICGMFFNKISKKKILAHIFLSC